MRPLASDIAARIDDALRALARVGVDAEDEAESLGVSAGQLSRWRTGKAKKPRRHTLDAWARQRGWPPAVWEEGGPMPSTLIAEGLRIRQTPRDYRAAGNRDEAPALVAVYEAAKRKIAAAGDTVPREVAERIVKDLADSAVGEMERLQRLLKRELDRQYENADRIETAQIQIRMALNDLVGRMTLELLPGIPETTSAAEGAAILRQRDESEARPPDQSQG